MEKLYSFYNKNGVVIAEWIAKSYKEALAECEDGIDINTPYSVSDVDNTLYNEDGSLKQVE